ncbi:MAG: fumarylacetoacetate hydrolase family protein [Ahrensia sp.]|nr:fumarylacetoacetate hydrolase family protein [Ahrensia sp.]
MNKTEIASAIAEARKAGEQVDIVLNDATLSRDDAMEIQGLAFEAFGSPSVGWKVGATNAAAQSNFGIDSPFYGPIAEAGVVKSGASLPKLACIGAMEPEYAFRMKRDFPAAGEEITEESAADAVDAVHVAIEMIGRCIGNSQWANGVGVTMDFGGNAAFVIGDAIKDWRSQDLVNTPVTAMVDGEAVETGNGEPVMGAPIKSLVWLAQQLAERGSMLKAGDWVSTGTCTPPVPAQVGKTLSAKFGALGSVSVSFT